MAVWALRVGFGGLAVVIVGVILLSAGATPWARALGVIVWLAAAAAAVTVTGVIRARGELPEPRPEWWSLRFMLIHDTVHARRAGPSS